MIHLTARESLHEFCGLSSIASERFDEKFLISNIQDAYLFRDLAGGSSSLLNGVPGGTNTGVVQLADLQRILSGLGQPSGADVIPFKLCYDGFK